MFATSEEQNNYKKQPPVCCLGPGGDYVRIWPAPKTAVKSPGETNVFSAISHRFDNLLRKIGLIFEAACEQKDLKITQSPESNYSTRMGGQTSGLMAGHRQRLDSPSFSDICPAKSGFRSVQQLLFDDVPGQSNLTARSGSHSSRNRRNPGKIHRKTDVLRQELLF